jgi:CTP-dependent riboflavin kinase
LGTAQGYFAERIAHDFGARVLALDATASPAWRKHRLVAYRVRRVTAENLAALGSFDVVLALSVLHHCPDWPTILEQLPALARRWLVLEVPNPRERLRVAPARGDLAGLHRAVAALGGKVLSMTGGVYDRRLLRELRAVPGRPLALRGVVTAGSGRHSVFSKRFRGRLKDEIGYRMALGSLNVKLEGVEQIRPLLGPPALRFVHRRKVDGVVTGCEYFYWPARFGAVAGHVMIPGARGHGPDCLELVAPVHLRTTLGLQDGDVLPIEVGA